MFAARAARAPRYARGLSALPADFARPATIATVARYTVMARVKEQCVSACGDMRDSSSGAGGS